jgi:hypothetical protein
MRLGRDHGWSAAPHCGRRSAGRRGAAGGIACSVLGSQPCTPTVCSPLDGQPCQPQYPFPLGQNLQVTVGSTQPKQGEHVDPDHPIDTIRDLFAALRACWQPPAANEAHAGMQMSVRFAFNRTGGYRRGARDLRRRASVRTSASDHGRSNARRCRSAPAWAAKTRESPSVRRQRNQRDQRTSI